MVKARWSEEETRLLARKEIELTKLGIKFLNPELALAFPDRTLEGIKGKRKQAAYKRLVADLMSEADLVGEDRGDGAQQAEDPFDYNTVIADYIRDLPPLNVEGFNPRRLVRICNMVTQGDRTAVLDELTLYLQEVFPLRPQSTLSKNRDCRNIGNVSRKEARRVEYARTQDLWRKNRSKCLRMILNDITGVKPPSSEVMVPFWRAIMTVDDDTSPGVTDVEPVAPNLWSPITPDEIRRAMPASTTSSGPDGLSARMLKKVPASILCRIFNLIMWCQQSPTYLLQSVTTLIPKKSGASLPSEFRPITVSSVLTRALHKIFASRLAGVKLDPRQRAFRPTDGCSENVFLLDLVLRHHREKHRPLFVASLDIAKAFDSVTHNTIRDTLKTMGLPEPMMSYIMDTYAKSTTRLCCDRWTSDIIQPRCGVKQGDPMSPIIFNMVINRLLTSIPDDIGARIGGINVNAAAFADDMLLFASTPVGLQRSLDICTDYLSRCGLQVNAGKCFTVSLRNVPHEKKTVVDKDTVFMCRDRVLPALKRTDDWRYLGVPFTPEGRVRIDATSKLRDAVEKLSRAPLKPQQRLFALRTMVIPGIFHQLELGNTMVGVLRKCDRLLRQSVRKWLNLPSDTPNAYFHATVRDGGLGIPSVRWKTPLRRLHRLRNLPITRENADTPRAFLDREILRCQERLRGSECQLETFTDLNKMWASSLYAGVDGAGLKESAKVPQQNVWLQDGTRFLSGRDFLMSCKLRVNALPTKSRTTRGRIRERLCRGGCNCAETLSHVLQKCHRTHGPRIRRHNALSTYVARALRVGGYLVFEEPEIHSERGLCKPDLLAKLGSTVLVVDAQVVNDQIDLDTAHRTKSNLYRHTEALIKRDYEVDAVRFTSITLSWRGIWSKESAMDLVGLGIIRKSALKVLSSRTIIGGLAAFRQFNRTTAVT